MWEAALSDSNWWFEHFNTVMVAFGVVFSAGGIYLATKNDLKRIKEQLTMLNKAVLEIAIQNNRLDNQDKLIASLQSQQQLQDTRIYELSRGRGFVKKELDREYP